MRRIPLVLVTTTLLVAGMPALAGDVPEVLPRVETPALYDDEAGGNADADDPAIWVDDRDPGRSLVITTAKQGGLYVYRLTGEQVQHLPAPAAPGPGHMPGRFNNVDLVGDLAVVSDRGRDQVRFYRVTGGSGPLTDVTAPDAPFVFAADQSEVDEQRTAYGLAAWYDGTDRATYVLVSRRETSRLALLRVERTAAGVSYRVVRTLDLPERFTLPDGTSWQPCDEPGVAPQVEGMVVDTRSGVLYAGQEDVGIWRLSARLTGRPVLLDKVREFGVPGSYDPQTEECVPGPDPGFGGRHLSADVEGLTIHRGQDLLLASSQGDDTFAAYRLSSGAFTGAFHVGDNGPVDGVQESDGAAVSGAYLGHRFPHGLLVVQDGQNTGGTRDSTNFKFVRWDDVVHAIR